MNAASIARSERLQRIDRLLSDGREYTTLEIVYGANVMAVSACISELRCNGLAIHCRRDGDIWYYRRDLLAEKRNAEKVAA